MSEQTSKPSVLVKAGVVIAVVTSPAWFTLAIFSALPAALALCGDARIVTYAGAVVPAWLANVPGVLLWTAAVAVLAWSIR